MYLQKSSPACYTGGVVIENQHSAEGESTNRVRAYV
jgi:hypothetical protein